MAKIAINIKEGKIRKPSDIIIGIDLGTTNSLVAVMRDGHPETIKSHDGKHTLVPSVIHFDENGHILVGDSAKSKLLEAPERTIYSAKRLMGKSYDDLTDLKSLLGYKIIDEDEEALVKVKVGDVFYNPIELSAEILKYLKERIETNLDVVVSKAVITVPAYFNDTQRQATRDAGKLAGLEVLRIVNEPTAASLAYGIGLNKEDHKTIAVYDLGGGTFDISILEIQEGVFEVLSTNGNTLLGGDDFDKVIIQKWLKDLGMDESIFQENKSLSQSFRTKAEEAKKVLSTEEIYETSIESHYEVSISKEQFEALIKPLLEKTAIACRQALKDADLKVDQIDEVVLVGGSTRTPAVKEIVEQVFGQKPNDQLNPDEVVALGAAIQADILAGNQKDFLLLDITPLSLGIETVGGLMDTIIPRNSKVPHRAGRQYTTSIDGQSKLKVAVYQGERDLVEHNRKLGEFILKGIPAMPAGLPKIDIHFILDADGILTVKAKELRSEVETSVEIRSQYGIGEEEMAQMLLDSIQNAKSDMEIRALLEARNEANNILQSTEKFLVQNQAILSKAEMEQIEKLKQSLQSMVENGSKDEINTAMDEINSYTSPIAHRAMDINIAEALKGKEL